jgi:tRNA_anti-like
MQNKTKKIILISAAVIIAVTAITGYLLWNKPHKNVKDADAAEITAMNLYNIFINDSIKARALYVDKVIQVSGEVAKLSVNQQAQQLVLFKTAVDGAYINCTMEEKASGFNAGDHIIIKGICSGYISGDIDMGLPGDVFLIRGYLFKKL